MADNSTSSGDSEKKVGRVSSLTRFMGSPLRSPSSRQKSPSKKSASPWARLSFGRILRKKSGKRQLESEESFKNTEEEANLYEATSEAVQSLAEKIKEEATQVIKLRDEVMIKPAEAKDSSSEVVEKKDEPVLANKVEQVANHVEVAVKEKVNETMEKIEESLKKEVISKDIVISETKDKISGNEHSQNEATDADNIDPVGGVEGVNTIVPTPRDQEEQQKEDSFNCVSSLAQGLQSLCAPRTAR